jgi:5-methylcytosine-specific restriction protein A
MHLRKRMYVKASVVDHIRPHRNDPELFWNSENFQSLCVQCHSIKTVNEDGGFGQ